MSAFQAGVQDIQNAFLRANFDYESIKNWKEQKFWHCTPAYFNALHDVRHSMKRCCFCHFEDGDYLELHHIDGNHNNYDPSNLAPICSLCHRTVHIGWSALSNLAVLTVLKRGIATDFNPDSNKDSFDVIPTKTNFLQEVGVDMAVHNNLQRFILVSQFHPQKQLEVFNRSNLKNGFEDLRDIAIRNQKEHKNLFKDLSLAGVLLAIIEAYESSENKKHKDYEHNNLVNEVLKLDGQADLALIFNSNVFAPYHKHCGYSYEQRIASYLENPLLMPSTMQAVFNS